MVKDWWCWPIIGCDINSGIHSQTKNISWVVLIGTLLYLLHLYNSFLEFRVPMTDLSSKSNHTLGLRRNFPEIYSSAAHFINDFSLILQIRQKTCLVVTQNFWPLDYYKILHMPWQNSCHGMCRILQWSLYWNLDETKKKFPRIWIMM